MEPNHYRGWMAQVEGVSFGEALDREIGEPGKDRGQIVKNRELQPPTAFHDRKDRCDLGSRLGTADVDPVFSSHSYRTH